MTNVQTITVSGDTFTATMPGTQEQRDAAVLALRNAKDDKAREAAVARYRMYYVDPDTAATRARNLANLAADADAAMTQSLLYMTGAIVALRHSHPKGERLGASTIGQILTGQPDSPALRKQWGRFANSLQAHTLSAHSVAKKLRKGDPISIREAYAELSRSDAKVSEVLAAAESGKDLPSVQAAKVTGTPTGHQQSNKPVSPAQFVARVSATVDALARVPRDKWTDDDKANARTQVAILQAALVKAIGAESANVGQAKSGPTPADVAKRVSAAVKAGESKASAA